MTAHSLNSSIDYHRRACDVFKNNLSPSFEAENVKARRKRDYSSLDYSTLLFKEWFFCHVLQCSVCNELFFRTLTLNIHQKYLLLIDQVRQFHITQIHKAAAGSLLATMQSEQ